APAVQQDVVIFQSSAFSGLDSLMTSRIQISTDATFTSALIDTMVNWRNVYEDDAAFNPINTNEGVDLAVYTFKKSRFVSGQTYYYRVRYRDHNLKWSDWSEETSFQIVTAVDEGKAAEIPDSYELGQNYPNPFNPSTIIAYQIPRNGHVSIKVYDALGQEVATLVDEEKPAGNYQVEFNTVNLSSGIYFYEMRSGEFTTIKKCCLMK
ncbi:MAG: T9SS type A sorting domain-containing protein, partial [Candidatus Zixiibacteriota bacterium]